MDINGSIFHRFAALSALAFAIAAPASAQPARVELDFDMALETDAAHAGTTVRAALAFRLPEGFHVNSDEPLDEWLIPTVLTLSPPDGITVRNVIYPDDIEVDVQFSEDPLAVYEHEFAIGVALDVDANVAPGAYVIPGHLVYQACDDHTCRAPDKHELELALHIVPRTDAISATHSPLFAGLEFPDEPAPDVPVVAPPAEAPLPTAASEDCDVMGEIANFTILSTAGGYLDTADFLEFIDGAETGAARKNAFEGKGPIAIVVLVILGGLALNLTPCVLPLIPINLGIIGAGVQASSRRRGFMLGALYGFAMAAVYGILGLIVILTAGTFGAINSTIWFNVAIAILFVVLGFAMFDLVHIDFSRLQSKLDVSRVSSKGKPALALAMGAVTALLAGACVAPVVIHVIVYAGDQYSKGIALALGLPFFLGLGMALPWPFAGAGLSFLPRPGAWMNRVKYALGGFILLFAAYYGYLAWQIYEANHPGLGGTQIVAANTELENGWTDSLCAGLTAAKEQEKLVLVDMWAMWCKNCHAMDGTTFQDPSVVARLDDYVKVKFQAEDLSALPAQDLIEHFQGIGLPTYAILRADGPRSQ